MSPEFWLQLAGMAFVAVGVYAAIKSDLTRAIERANGAHQRLDDHLSTHKGA